MSIVLVGSTSGSCTLQEQAVAGNTTLTLPTVSGTILTTGSSGQSIPKAALPTGSVLQVVSTTKTDTFTSTTANAFTDITGMSASITPTSSTSKVLVTVTGTCSGQAGVSGSILRLVRGSTAICVGDASGSRSPASTNAYQADASQSVPFSISFLDSPATTSSTTYKIQFYISSGTFYFNITQNDQNAGYTGRFASTITVMEIAA